MTSRDQHGGKQAHDRHRNHQDLDHEHGSGWPQNQGLSWTNRQRQALQVQLAVMAITVSTTAFDSVLERRPGLHVWTARGFVSRSVCGFDLFVEASSDDAAILDRISSELMWWGTDGPEASLSIALTSDGASVPLLLAASGTSVDQRAGAISARVSIEFPSPRGTEMVLTTASESWRHSASVALDAADLTRALTDWETSVGARD